MIQLAPFKTDDNLFCRYLNHIASFQFYFHAWTFKENRFLCEYRGRFRVYDNISKNSISYSKEVLGKIHFQTFVNRKNHFFVYACLRKFCSYPV